MIRVELPRTGFIYRRTSKDLVGDFFHEMEKEVLLRFSVLVFTRPELCAQVRWTTVGDLPEILQLGKHSRTLAITEVVGYLKEQRIAFQRLGWEMMTEEIGYFIEQERATFPLNVNAEHTLSYKLLEDMLYLISPK